MPRGYPPRPYTPPVNEQQLHTPTPYGKRAYGVAFEESDPSSYDPTYQEYAMQQDFIAHAALSQFYPPMDDTYYDEAGKLNHEVPSDYSTTDNSDN